MFTSPALSPERRGRSIRHLSPALSMKRQAQHSDTSSPHDPHPYPLPIGWGEGEGRDGEVHGFTEKNSFRTNVSKSGAGDNRPVSRRADSVARYRGDGGI